MDIKIEDSWKSQLADEFSKEYFLQLIQFVKSEYKSHMVFPPGKQIFNAFDNCPFEKTKVVIIGQDPYHGSAQAHGLCFSVVDGIPKPPSLLNIFKELKLDIGKEIPINGNLINWAQQGVLMLNATLTVRANEAGSHQNKGWEIFTDAVIKKLSDHKENLVFILWGAYAQKKASYINRKKHLILESAHPSPLSASRGFFGQNHFSKTNAYLEKNGKKPIAW
ncbi:MAG: uracil-DNA glycosylase [Candidatus Nitrotoga sp.]